MARIPVNCGCEDAPCCGCNEVVLTGEDAREAIEDDMLYMAETESVDDLSLYRNEPDDSMDGDFDSAMASAGHGTDEDYGFYGDEIDFMY